MAVLHCYAQNNQEINEQIDALISGKPKKVTQDHVYRQVGTGAQILRELGVKRCLMSAPFKFSALSGFDLEVVDVLDNAAVEID